MRRSCFRSGYYKNKWVAEKVRHQFSFFSVAVNKLVIIIIITVVVVDVSD